MYNNIYTIKVGPHLETLRITADQQILEFMKSLRTRKVNDGLIITVFNMVTGCFHQIDFSFDYVICKMRHTETMRHQKQLNNSATTDKAAGTPSGLQHCLQSDHL